MGSGSIVPSKQMKNRRSENFHISKLISLLSDDEDVYSNEQFPKVAN
jgi:hypothetical protein